MEGDYADSCSLGTSGHTCSIEHPQFGFQYDHESEQRDSLSINTLNIFYLTL